MTLKKIEIATVRFVFDDDEPKEVKRTIKVEPKEEPVAKPKAEPKPRKTRAIFTDEQKADIIRRYKNGEGPKKIAESINCARSTIGLIIKKAGVVEGRTGQHLNKPKPEPQSEADENEPV